MDRIVRVRRRGTLTLPADLREKYDIRSGDVLHLLDLDGVFVLTRTAPRVPELAHDIERMRREAGLTVEALLSGLREQVRRWLGWDRVERSEEYRRVLTEHQKRELPRRKQEATNNLPEAVVGAYNLLVAVDEDGEVRVQTLRHREGSAFDRIKATLSEEERILLTTLDPDLLLPGSYLDLWRPGEESKRVETPIQAFGQFPRLPRLLRPEALYDSLRWGVQEGLLVLRIVRGDGSVRTFWRIPPDEETLRRPDLEVQPARRATLHTLDADLLRPGAFDAFWPTPQGPVSLGAWRAVFDGEQAPRLATLEVLEEAVRVAVQKE